MTTETEYQTLARWRRHDERMIWLERMKSFGSLYAPTYEQTMARVIREDCAKALGFAPDQVMGIPVAEEPWSAPDCASRMERCTCGCWDVRIFSCEAGWRCEHCGRPVGNIWGCLECTRCVCDDCVWFSRVPSDYVEGMTLEGIAHSFEVNRERIRQIEQRALKKLYEHPIVYELWTGNVSKRRRAPVGGWV